MVGADVALRSYVFQRDVVDYLALKFVHTARFVQPVLSTPDVPMPPAVRGEMEFGLELDDYLEGLGVDAMIPEDPEISALAGSPSDAADGRSQATKVRALTYFAKGLGNLHQASERIRGGQLAPATTTQLEFAEAYFEGAAKMCTEGRSAFPEHPFYPVFEGIATGAAGYVKARRLHAYGYYSPELLTEAEESFAEVFRGGSLHLSRSQRASVFADPSKAKMRDRVGSTFVRAAGTNARIASMYRAEVDDLPRQVEQVSMTMRGIMEKFIRSKGLAFFAGVGLIITLLLLTLALLPFSQRIILTVRTLAFPLGAIVTAVILTALLSHQSQRRQALVQQYAALARTTAYNLKRRIDILTANSPPVIYHYVRPWDLIHWFYLTRMAQLGWVVTPSRKQALLEELGAIALTPTPLTFFAPPSLLEPKRDRRPEEVASHPGLDMTRTSPGIALFMQQVATPR